MGGKRKAKEIVFEPKLLHVDAQSCKNRLHNFALDNMDSIPVEIDLVEDDEELGHTYNL